MASSRLPGFCASPYPDTDWTILGRAVHPCAVDTISLVIALVGFLTSSLTLAPRLKHAHSLAQRGQRLKGAEGMTGMEASKQRNAQVLKLICSLVELLIRWPMLYLHFNRRHQPH